MTRPWEDPFPKRFDADRFEARLRQLVEREPFVFPTAEVPAHYRRASVLICFWREDADLRVILTRRAATLSRHPGQMSFPGGGLEGDETWEEAAIRETEEEIGIPRQSIEVLGRLDDAWSGAGHLLAPIVGWLDRSPRFTPDPAEVEAIHTPSVSALMEPSAYSEEPRRFGSRTFYNPILSWIDDRVFGLSTDLLIEALRWGSGLDESPGPLRLEALRAYLETKQLETKQLETQPSTGSARSRKVVPSRF